MHSVLLCMLAISTLCPTKKLIEWSGATTNVMFRENPEMYEAAPFDGMVMTILGKDGKGTVDIGWDSWGKKAFTREQFVDAIKDLKETPRKKFTDCFLRFNSAPGEFSFFDEEAWAVALNNSKLAAWIAKEVGAKGLMFDNEAYGVPTFGYPHQNSLKPASVEEYQQLTRRRGAEFIRAINSEYPDITILMTFAHSLLIREIDPWRESGYVLLAVFADGMMEAQDDKTTIVDALELAYPSKTRQDIERLRALVRSVGREFSMVPEIYDKRMKVGFGIWIDYDSAGRGWDPHHPEKNYYQPEVLQDVLRHALELSDGYVWLYSERLNWYTRKAMTEPYLQAVANAQSPPKRVPASKPSP